MASPKDKKVIRVGSRKSELALIQTNYVVAELEKKFPEVSFEVITMTTTGDQILDRALSKIGEKSLFTKELEVGLEEKRVDFVVHSLKDLPTTLPPNMVIGAILEREDPRDAVIMKRGSTVSDLGSLPAASVVGTSSVRRAAQLRARFPQLQFKDVRGNLNTRFRKLDEADDYAALILAAAGVKRMGWEDRISHLLSCSDCTHAVGQGALAIECREDDPEILAVIGTLSHASTLVACVAERAFMRTLEGGCSAPVAAHGKVKEGEISLQGGVWSLDGSEALKKSMSRRIGASSDKRPRTFASVRCDSVPTADLEVAEQLGHDLAEELLNNGAGAILQKAKEANAK